MDRSGAQICLVLFLIIFYDWSGMFYDWSGIVYDWSGIIYDWSGIIYDWSGVFYDWSGFFLRLVRHLSCFGPVVGASLVL